MTLSDSNIVNDTASRGLSAIDELLVIITVTLFRRPVT